jgi:hypothetical protein
MFSECGLIHLKKNWAAFLPARWPRLSFATVLFCKATKLQILEAVTKRKYSKSYAMYE